MPRHRPEQAMHEWDPDEQGDCRHCPFPQDNARHPQPAREGRPARDGKPKPGGTDVAPDVPLPPVLDDGTRTGMDHPQQSFDAALHLAPQHGLWRQRVLDAVAAYASHGRTDRELEAYLAQYPGATHQTVTSARNSLVESGWLEPLLDGDGDQVKRSPTGKRPSGVWVLSAAGHRQYVPSGGQ